VAGYDEHTANAPMSREGAAYGGYGYDPYRPPYGYYGRRRMGGYRRYGGYGSYGGPPRPPTETKPFFLTSEFLGTLLAVIALACTAAAMPNLGARLTWILLASMVTTYVVSRGLAKAGTRSHAFDPREELFREQNGGQQEAGSAQPSSTPRTVHAVETKPFFLTSEFLVTLLAIIALAISGATIGVLNVRVTWILITAMVCGYVLSRGIAKIGVGSESFDPREQMMERVAPTRRADEQTTSVR
jgi:multisubunit Na+/H+ antiporter MnhG subunit